VSVLGETELKATSGKKISKNMAIVNKIVVPLEFRLSQRGANSATTSSFII
jgi:hypothetical protein